ncbi:MAG: hypothetical protein IKB98_04495 [Clostridia bacterium]|nr:hypothetical protein [Clostridia bacterium]
MSEGSFLKAEARCPFYKRDKDMRKIACEGLVPRSNIIVSFAYLKDFEKHFFSFCGKEYQNCLIFRALMEKYNE